MKRKPLLTSLAFLLVIYLLCPPISWGQTDYRFEEDDLLKEMDKAVEAPPEQKGQEKVPQVAAKQSTVLSKLVDDFHGSLRLRGMHYWQNPPEREGSGYKKRLRQCPF